MNRYRPSLLLAVFFCVIAVSTSLAQAPAKLTAHWDKVTGVSKTTATLQVVVNPPLRRGSAIHDNAFKSLHDIQADYVRYVPWLPYPKLAVAELEPPANGKTSWDFSLIDPMTIDFLEATKGHSVILNFSTIPAWMFKTDKPVTYPADPDQPVWDYTQGTEFRDPTMKEVGDYYGRLFSWYTQGGFTDELGKRHESGYHYSIPYWEVLNEIEFEHQMTPETYTRLYDSVVESIRRGCATNQVRGPGAGPAFDAPRAVRILSQSQKPQARHSPRFHLLSFLCGPYRRSGPRHAALHFLRLCRRLP